MLLQFAMVSDREPPQQRFAFVRQLHQYGARILRITDAPDQPALLRTIDQFHGAVMLEQHAAGDLAHRHSRPFGKGPHRQQQLMLLRLHAAFPGRLLAELEEAPHQETEFSQGGVFRLREIPHLFISYHDVFFHAHRGPSARTPRPIGDTEAMSVYQERREELEQHEFMMGLERGRLAVTLDLLTDALVLVGQHGVYCQSARQPGKPAMDIQMISKSLADAKELVASVMEHLKPVRESSL